MTTIHIPPAALEAGMAAYEKAVEEAEYSEPEDWMRAAFVAMVTAWEGMVDHPETASSPRCLWLPLTEKQDDKA